MANHQRTCKWCGDALHGQRLAKTYCSNACKQSAYNYRRKTASPKGIKDIITITTGRQDSVTASPVVTVIMQANVTSNRTPTVTADDIVTVSPVTDVKKTRQETVTMPDFVTASNLPNQPEMATESLKNKQIMQSDQQNKQNAPDPSTRIMVMGMTVTREWITGLLGSVPEPEQRELSMLFLQTIIEVFPDMVGLLGAGDTATSQPTVTDEGLLPETLLQDEDEYEGGYPNDTATSFDSESDDNDESGDDGFSDEPDNTFDDETEADDNGYDDRLSDVTETLSDFDTLLREESVYSKTSYSRPEAPARSALKKGTGVTNTHQPVSESKRSTIDAPDYLERFSSPFICRGMDVWEELSVTVPLFMEAYVIQYAYDTDMQTEVEEQTVDGMTTVHLLFHRADHRRQISRLLDLVLEAAEGLLSESDFEGDGEFSTEAPEGNNDTGDDGDIDYDPYDEETDGQARYVTQQTGLQPYTTLAQNTLDMGMALQLLSITKAA